MSTACDCSSQLAFLCADLWQSGQNCEEAWLADECENVQARRLGTEAAAAPEELAAADDIGRQAKAQASTQREAVCAVQR